MPLYQGGNIRLPAIGELVMIHLPFDVPGPTSAAPSSVMANYRIFF